MSEQASGEAAPRKRWTRRIASVVIGLIVSLIVGKIIETVSDRAWLAEAEAAQKQWITAVGETSPIGVGAIYWDEITAVMGDGRADTGYDLGIRPTSTGMASPLVAFWYTAERVIHSGGIVAIVQLALGALALAVMNYLGSDGKTIFFQETQSNIIGLPLCIILLASLLGGALWLVLMGALYLLGWVTSLAVWAAGATGIVGFCWLCVTKLGEKGFEHIATPKI